MPSEEEILEKIYNLDHRLVQNRKITLGDNGVERIRISKYGSDGDLISIEITEFEEGLTYTHVHNGSRVVLELACAGNQQKVLIHSLLRELDNAITIEDLLNTRVQELAIKLASITPREDFLNMFTNLRDFEVSRNGFNNDICFECIESIQLEWNNSNELFDFNQRIAEKKNCNCKWTCGWNPMGYDMEVITDCNPTSRNCGFLLLQSCEKRDDIKL